MKNKKPFLTEVRSQDVLSVSIPDTRSFAGAQRKSFRVWWIAFRYHFVPASFLPAILGSVGAWVQTGLMNRWFFFLTVLGVTLNHIALNMTDDYFDYHAAVDQGGERRENPYTGGSGTLTGGLIKHGHMRLMFTLFYLITIGIGLYLCAAQTWWIIVFGLFGVGCSYFYTAPPIRYGYRGLGEFSQLINFSFTIGMGAYVVQTVSFSWEIFWILLPLGFMMFAMIVINEIPDRFDDASAGKNTLVVRFGLKAAARFYGVAMMLAYAVILLAPPLNMAGYWIYLGLLTLPWSVRAFLIMKAYGNEPDKLAPANLLTIRVHNFTGILLIIACLIQGLQDRQVFQPVVFAAVILSAFYLPAAISIFFKKMPDGRRTEA